jgi:acylphosphatase
MTADSIHYQLLVKGRVQGVGYRAFASRLAAGYNLKGYVKNMPDGSVRIEVEGPREILDQFVHSCKEGPVWARVEEVLATQSPIEGYSDFKVRY